MIVTLIARFAARPWARAALRYGAIALACQSALSDIAMRQGPCFQKFQ